MRCSKLHCTKVFEFKICFYQVWVKR
jgi:hypothetical protein